jgi:hypothetical protein
MLFHTTVRSPGAIALGAVCALGTLVVLFWYVRSPSDFTLNHLYILLALLVTLGAGHFMWDAFGEWSFGGFIRGAAFLVLFCVGTVVCVALSGGRSAELLERKEADAGHENGKRLAHEAHILSAKKDLDDATAAYDKAETDAADKAEAMAVECGTGKRSRCDGKTLTSQTADTKAAEKKKARDQADSHYWMLVGQLANFKAPQVANAELKAFAKVWALVRSIDEKHAMPSVLLLLPYCLALLTEFGTIVFFKHGFGRRRVAAALQETQATDGPGQLPANSRQPGQPNRGNRPSGTMSKQRAAQFLVTHLALHGRVESQDWLAEQCGVNKGVMSKWMADWEREGLIARSRVGRCKEIVAAS